MLPDVLSPIILHTNVGERNFKRKYTMMRKHIHWIAFHVPGPHAKCFLIPSIFSYIDGKKYN